MKWKEAIAPSVIASLITALAIGLAGRLEQVNIRWLLGIPRIERGVIIVQKGDDYPVTFDPPFPAMPVITFGAFYADPEQGEAFATMVQVPTKNGFVARLVRGTSARYATGRIYWMAIEASGQAN